MLQPKRVRHLKAHRGRRKGVATGATTLAFGEWGLKSMEPVWLTARQIEAARRAIVRNLRRGGQVWIRVFPDKPVSKKPAETRMGGGKAAVDHWVAVVKRGRILFELGGVREDVAREAFRLASQKLPISTKMVTRADYLAPVTPAAEVKGEH
ncbi:MAG: 50S ribosomal protein L16 [Chloroflexi bacterium]|nr:50S ribosomal protein L16 [Chloroflexota bacterium]